MKKCFSLAMVLLIAMFLLAACKKKSGDGGSTPPAADNSGGTPAVTAPQEPVTTAPLEPVTAANDQVTYDRVIYDDNGMKVTLTGYQHEPGSSYISKGHYWYFTIEIIK